MNSLSNSFSDRCNKRLQLADMWFAVCIAIGVIIRVGDRLAAFIIHLWILYSSDASRNVLKAITEEWGYRTRKQKASTAELLYECTIT